MNEKAWRLYAIVASFLFFISINVMLISYSNKTIGILVKKAPIERLSPSDRDQIAKRISLSLQQGLSIQVWLESGKPAFTPQEVLHMDDVSQLLRINRYLGILYAILLIIGIKIAPSLEKQRLQLTGNWLIGLFFISLCLILFFFPPLFWIFHQVSFTNQHWLLDPQHHILIQIFPLAFFQWAVAGIFIISAGMAYFLWHLVPSITGKFS